MRLASPIIRARPAPPPARQPRFSAREVLDATTLQATRLDTLQGNRTDQDMIDHEAYFLTIPNGTVIVTGREVFYLSEDGTYFPDYYPKPWVYQEHLGAGQEIEIDCSGLAQHDMPVTGFAPFLVAGNWFHTLLDNYARMYFLDFLEAPGLSVITPGWVLPPGPGLRCDRRLVNALFMAGRNQLPLAPGIYHFDKIVLPPLGNQDDYIFRRPLAFVSKRLHELLPPKPARHKSRLFISRADTNVRTIDNEPELLAALRPLGITPICPGDYSFPTQLELFASAELLLGVHGQGFTPLVCARDCRQVMELEAADWNFTAYRSIASCLGIPYEKLSGRLVEHRDTARFDWRALADIPACTAQVEAALRRL